MGFTEYECREAIKRYDGNHNLALNYLLEG